MKTKTDFRWLIRIVLVSVTASMVFTLATTEVLAFAGHFISFTVLALFIIIGIVFDMIGIAVTSASEAPFHSMAAHRERGAAESLKLIRSADKVASFCNDVVGDVSGIISGAMAALIAARLTEGVNAESVILPLLISGSVTGLTIGGKAAGKTYAFNNNTEIVLKVGKLLNFLKPATRPDKKDNKRRKV